MNNTTSESFEIQVWNTFGPIRINETVGETQFRMRIDTTPLPLPSDLQARVNENWVAVTAKSPNAKDNLVLYVTSPVVEENGVIVIPTTARTFRYTAAFNRNPTFHDDVAALNQHRLLTISTHCHLVTRDGKLLFGTKVNQFNQISGFAGFPNAAKEAVEIDGTTYLNTYETVRGRLADELKNLSPAVQSINAVGIVYVGRKALRGTDVDYLVRLDETATEAQRIFRDSYKDAKQADQFSRDLFAVDFNPSAVSEFIEQVHREGKAMSPYAMGCAVAVANAYFGMEEAERVCTAVREKAGITIANKNETEYFG